MISTPIKSPPTEPVPPKNEVPPSTAAAMASVSYPSPVDGCPDASRDARTTPQKPARIPLIVHTRILIFFTLIPEKRADTSLPPTA